MNSFAIETQDLIKIYNGRRILTNISLSIKKGEVFGILGPNGAGKSTLLNIILGLKKLDSGKVCINGYNPFRQSIPIREKIGVQLETSTLPGLISVQETLALFHSFYTNSIDIRKIVKMFGFQDFLKYKVGILSKGWKQRLEIAVALIGNPEILILDEPTGGLDPHIKEKLWEIFLTFKSKKKTILLSTHYIEEAEKLCDRVSIIDGGKVILTDEPRNIISNFGFSEKIIVNKSKSLKEILAFYKSYKIYQLRDIVIIYSNSTADVINNLKERGIKYTDFKVQRVDLNDIFLNVTGRRIKE